MVMAVVDPVAGMAGAMAAVAAGRAITSGSWTAE